MKQNLFALLLSQLTTFKTKFRYSHRDEKKSNTPSICYCMWLQVFLLAVDLIFIKSVQFDLVFLCLGNYM